jgi:hypothetical protein
MRDSSIFSGISHLIVMFRKNCTLSYEFMATEKLLASPRLELIFHKNYFIMKDTQRDKSHSQHALARHLERLRPPNKSPIIERFIC